MRLRTEYRRATEDVVIHRVQYTVERASAFGRDVVQYGESGAMGSGEWNGKSGGETGDGRKRNAVKEDSAAISARTTSERKNGSHEEKGGQLEIGWPRSIGQAARVA